MQGIKVMMLGEQAVAIRAIIMIEVKDSGTVQGERTAQKGDVANGWLVDPQL